MKICDIVRFSKERCFNGAVQTEWFYDINKVKSVADSYVFHGPKYFGVSDSDVSLGGHRLIDTASFALNLATKLGTENPSNSFVMTIAGYGAGKSHLAVSLAALFSGQQDLEDFVIHNICIADKAIASEVAQLNKKKNFVIVLNGMNNFNLDSEVLRCVKMSLEQNGLPDDVLRRLTKSYDIARHFVEKTYSLCQGQFEEQAKKKDINYTGEQLKSFLLTGIESDNDALTVINNVYKELNGDSIQWDRGLSAGDILSAVYKELCGVQKPFNKVLILFDEFGRYIEYAAAKPAVAGESALQQIFESVQSAEGGIIFVGFVQSELDSYLARIEKTSNIMRYVGRYKCSENLFLSSNFETILANLLQKVDEKAHDRIIEGALLKYENYHWRVYNSISRWDKANVKKSVWVSDDLYKIIILKGCYPLHPITVWLLSNMHNWMQQRSAITFAAEMVEKIAMSEIDGARLLYVYPINIVDSSIYNEMLNSEEKGLVQSQYCMLYRDIMLKIGDKLVPNELIVLKAILIVNIGRFAFFNREEALSALKYCTNIKEEEIALALKGLENVHGVVSFDENAKTFDLIAEANGFNEFKRVFNRYRIMTKDACIDDCDDSLQKELSLNIDIETSFARQHDIVSNEWKFHRCLMDSAAITEKILESRIRALDNDYSGDGYRGEIIFAYCAKNASSEIFRLTNLFNELDLAHHPLIITFLDDADGEIVAALTNKKTLNCFSNSDNERFQKHVLSQQKIQNKKIIKKFNLLVQNRTLISESGAIQYQGRLNGLCTSKFEEVYVEAPAFMFDGFENKSPAAARRYLANICIKMFDRTLMNIQSYNALSTEEKNRVKATLAVGITTSWQVFNNNCSFIKPQNAQLLRIFNCVENALLEDESQSVMQLFGLFVRKPYGMNINAIALFVFYFIAYKDKDILCYYNNEKLQACHISDKIFKGSKLQPQEFLKIQLQKNVHVNTDLLQELCQKIMNCSSVEQCPTYKKKLEVLLAQEGTSVENQLTVASALTRIDEGIGLRDDIYEKLKKGKEIIAEAKEGFKLQKFMKVFHFFLNTEIPVKDNFPFVYSDHFKGEMLTLKQEVSLLMESSCSNAIQCFSCKITQLSQFKSICSNMSKTLRENGYEGYAKELEARVTEVEADLLAKQKYESSLVELDKELAMDADVSKMGYPLCMEALQRVEGWKRFFDAITDMPVKMADAQKKKIEDAITLISARVREVSNNCHDIINDISLIKSISDLKKYEDKLKNALLLGLNNEDTMLVNQMLSQILVAKSFIDTFPETIDELKCIGEKLSNLEFGSCYTVVEFEYIQKLNDLTQKRDEWIDRYILPVEEKVDTMGTIDCSNWMSNTEELPKYLDSTSMDRYQDAIIAVENRLHKSRVQGVLVMYNKLNVEEKKEFQRLIADV